MKSDEIRCPPYVAPQPYRHDDGTPPTILELASRASSAVVRYRYAMDGRLPFDAVLRAAGELSRATDELAMAIADSVACGDGRLY